MPYLLLMTCKDAIFIINDLQRCHIYYVYQMKIDTYIGRSQYYKLYCLIISLAILKNI